MSIYIESALGIDLIKLFWHTQIFYKLDNFTNKNNICCIAMKRSSLQKRVSKFTPKKFLWDWPKDWSILRIEMFLTNISNIFVALNDWWCALMIKFSCSIFHFPLLYWLGMITLVLGIILFKETLLKGKPLYNLTPCIIMFRSIVYETVNIIYFFTKQCGGQL